MPNITIKTKKFTEVSEQPGKVVYSDISTANTEPFLIEIKNNGPLNGSRAARNATVVVRTIVPYGEKPAMTESISASFTLRFQPSVLYPGKQDKISAVVEHLAKLLTSTTLRDLLVAGGVDAGDLNIA